ncbi:hypothetical protein COV06_00865 [Candidatus Uhrbacteria bacterium CG10_big_fil_rev_8_21_14_0_10_50_16]|uniref:M23ase beta-sheet core domain-containing protein n=1 Tax=Candidatus Uhrbacteria bacterium CG10_big_fil_rev_8_21_14_0_10_50_16 TaxID=1975039 RepID=A0A2H0RNB5_9BACT|nr:MAG: hypothetical protein COV06_00865 [Candidatus Uhrbacteria bacterium CG10_big_fil_rev_8_21_14_0_10_50_16]
MQQANLFQRYVVFPILLALFATSAFVVSVSATTVDQLSTDIENKQAEIDGIRNKIDQFQDKIVKAEQQQKSLSNELSILENRVKKTQLDIQSAQLSIDKVELEINKTREEIVSAEQQITEARTMIGIVLKELYQVDDAGPIEVLFGHDVFSEFFDQVQYLETLQEDLSLTLERVKTLSAQLSAQQEQQTEQKERLVSMREELQKTKLHLEQEKAAKDSLLAAAENSEAQFGVLLRELSEERQYIQTQIFRLQEEVNRKIDEGDEQAQELIGPTILSWPVTGPVITATFHDPTYPFRHLFEHSGLDMAVPYGTQLRAAAPGYVAWALTGRSYGNYIMIIHANGVATLYAHLSQMDVRADQFVERGQPIGKTGGIPGTPGAGLSTGAHLHFEVRENGIPVNPYEYLINQ